MMRMGSRLHYVGLLAVLGLAGCRPAAPPPAAAGASSAEPVTVAVAATIFPLADIARSLGGAAFRVTTLLPSGSNPHTFELTPQQARQVAEAKVILRVGPGVDDWLDKILGTTGGRVLAAVDCTKTIQGEVHHHEEGGHEEAHGHDHQGDTGAGATAPDPHVWLDPVRMRDDLAPAVAAALTVALPAEKPGIDDRLRQLQKQLSELDDDLRATLSGLASKRYIAGHRAWAYFNERYGLEMVAVVEPMPGTDPSARWLKEVVQVAKDKQARAVFAEVQLNPELSRTVAREAGLKFGELDDQGGDNVAGRNNYAALLRYNAAQFAAGLKP